MIHCSFITFFLHILFPNVQFQNCHSVLLSLLTHQNCPNIFRFHSFPLVASIFPFAKVYFCFMLLWNLSSTYFLCYDVLVCSKSVVKYYLRNISLTTQPHNDNRFPMRISLPQLFHFSTLFVPFHPILQADYNKYFRATDGYEIFSRCKMFLRLFYNVKKIFDKSFIWRFFFS